MALLTPNFAIFVYFGNPFAGEDPGRSLTRGSTKSSWVWHMGVALTMGLYTHDVVDTAQLST